MERINEHVLQILRERINELTGAPASPHKCYDPKVIHNVGHYVITCNYAGKRTLARFSNEKGELDYPLGQTYHTMSELAEILRGFIAGLEAAND